MILPRSGALSSNTHFPDAFGQTITYMHKKLELPKISNKEAEALARACRMAYGDQSIDHFMNQVFESLRERRRQREELGQMWFTE